MTLSETHHREWRQLRLLSKDATRRLINAALLSGDGDPAGFALWMLALVATPPLLFSVAQGMNYAFLKRAPVGVFERVLLGDRLFFVIYAMLTAVLLAGLFWEALFPNRAEQEIVGVLPVRARTFAAARLVAAMRLCVIVALAIAVPPALVFTLFAASHPALRSMHTIFVGHVVGTTLGCMFIFLTLLVVRGAMAVSMGTRAGNWIAVVLQVVAIVSLVEVFFFLPRVLSVLVQVLQSGQHTAYFPPLWFAALFSWIAGHPQDSFPALAGLAVAATTLVAALNAAVYLASASWVARRTLEAQERHRQHPLMVIAAWLATFTRSRPGVRGMFLFTVASLVRSRRHLLMLSAYISLALATVIFGLAVAGMRRPVRSGAPARLEFAATTLLSDHPTATLLGVPLVFLFFLVLGLRACFRVPTDAAANWPFRLRPPTPAQAAAAAWLSLFTLAVAPVTLLTATGAAVLWSLTTAAAVAVLTLASGVVLIETALIGWAMVPFACEHEPSADSVRWKWMAGLAALSVFAFGLSGFQALALGSTGGIAVYLTAMAGCVTLARLYGRRVRRSRPMTFDVPDNRAAALRLSEA